MAKQPAFQLYTGDWLKDPRLSMCSEATRGIWIDLICSMHELDRCGKIVGTYEQIARICRSTAVQVSDSLHELKITKTADVTERNGVVTVINRRMRREYLERVSLRERQRRHREKTQKKRKNNAEITPLSSSSISTTNPPIIPPGDESGIRGFVIRFYDYQYKHFPKQLKEYKQNPEKLINDSMGEVEKLIRLDGYSIEDIRQVLWDAVNDEFWQANVISLRGIRKKSKSNGLTKFANLYSRFGGSKAKKKDIPERMKTVTLKCPKCDAEKEVKKGEYAFCDKCEEEMLENFYYLVEKARLEGTEKKPPPEIPRGNTETLGESLKVAGVT